MLSRDTSSLDLCFLSLVGIPSRHYFPNPHRRRNPVRARFFLLLSRLSLFLKPFKILYCIPPRHAILAAHRLRKCGLVSFFVIRARLSHSGKPRSFLSFPFTRGLATQKRVWYISHVGALVLSSPCHFVPTYVRLFLSLFIHASL